MLIANIATYPPRAGRLEQMMSIIAPGVDRVNLILNEYDDIPAHLAKRGNVVPVIPEEDTKDTGKFLPEVGDSDLVFLVDDDLIYPTDYFSRSADIYEALGEGKWVGGYHGTFYSKFPKKITPKKLLQAVQVSRGNREPFKNTYHYSKGLAQHRKVAQIGTGTALLRGNLMPPFEYMRTSQKFVDIRFGRWCAEQGISMVCFAREKDWLNKISFRETIRNTFTRRLPQPVVDEIRSYALDLPDMGKPVG